MHKARSLTLITVICMTPLAAHTDTGRSYGTEDTARHQGQSDTRRSKADTTDQPAQRKKSRGIYHPKPQSEQHRYGYWSRKCIRQRSSSLAPLVHTRDCDHPAYSGGYYPTPYPAPYGPGAPVIIINNHKHPGYR